MLGLFIGKNLYNNEHVAIKLVIHLVVYFLYSALFNRPVGAKAVVYIA